MKRDPRLRGLSDDHHRALVLARRAIEAASGTGERSPADVWTEVLQSFARELEPHFELEERLLLPALERVGETALVTRTRADHETLRGLVSHTETAVQERLAVFGGVLRDHIRFEERFLFVTAEKRLADSVLEAIAATYQTRA